MFIRSRSSCSLGCKMFGMTTRVLTVSSGVLLLFDQHEERRFKLGIINNPRVSSSPVLLSMLVEIKKSKGVSLQLLTQG